MWGSAIKLAKDNWCLIVPRPYEVPHECDRLYPGAQGRNIYQSTCSSVAKTDLMHALHFQYKYSGMQSQSLRFPCCKIREASRGKKKNERSTWHRPKGQGCPVLTPWRWSKPPQHWLKPRGFWRGDQVVSHTQWKASLLLHGDEIHVYPETCKTLTKTVRS